MDTNISNNLTARELILITILSSSVVSVLASSLFGWIKSWWNLKKQEEKRLLKIKENSYKEVMENIDFIYAGNNIIEIEQKKKNFLQNYRIMFLYCNDEMVKEINNILYIMSNQEPDNPEIKTKKEKIARSMIAIRKNINKKTKLTYKDFKHVN